MQWSGNDAGFERVGILVKKEISGKVVEVKRKNGRVKTNMLTFGKKVIQIMILGHLPLPFWSHTSG